MTSATYDEMILGRELEEQRWAYEQRRRRLTYPMMADLAPLPIEQGGLGRKLGPETLSKRCRAYMAEMRVLEDATREEYRQRELDDLDAQQRELQAMTARIDTQASQLLARRLTGRTMSLEDIWAEAPEAIVLRDERVIGSAVAGLTRVSESRRKLLGLDAPQQTEVALTASPDAVVIELNEMLRRNGLDAVER